MSNHQSPPNYMKTTPDSILIRTAFLIISLSLSSGGLTVAEARDPRLLSPGPVRPSGLDYPAVWPHGFLKVYSATDKFNDGDAWYFPHSSYAIYTIDGKLVRSVENHISRNDEVPETVALPGGYYLIDGRSEKNGYVRVRVLVRPGQQTILDMDLADKEPAARLAHN
jgi:hypothetical protein